MTLSHLKARIYVLIDKENEAIKVLKKWKKLDLKETGDRLAFYMLGYLYAKANNTKEALRWFRKVFIDRKGRELSLCFVGIRNIFLALYEIARIKFEQKEYQIAELILKEFHATFTDSDHLFTDPERLTSEQKCWDHLIESMSERFQITEELLKTISKLDENVKNGIAMPPDLVQTIKTFESNRIELNTLLESGKRSELDIQVEEEMKAGQFKEALETFHNMFDDMKLEDNPQLLTPIEEQVLHNKFCGNFENLFKGKHTLICKRWL